MHPTPWFEQPWPTVGLKKLTSTTSAASVLCVRYLKKRSAKTKFCRKAVTFIGLPVITVGSDSCRIEWRLPETNTDELLLERAVAGDEAAFQQLYDRHRKAIFRFAYRLSGSVEDAEDITHDCFLSLIKRASGFDARRTALRTYLFGATRNLWLKQLRLLGRELALDEFDENGFVAETKPPIDNLLDSELSLRVSEAVAALPPLQREALVLFEYEGLSLSEIARIVGSDVGAVKGRLFRGRERLRKSLQPYLNSHREIVTLENA